MYIFITSELFKIWLHVHRFFIATNIIQIDVGKEHIFFLFDDTLNTFFVTVIWHQTYGYGQLK